MAKSYIIGSYIPDTIERNKTASSPMLYDLNYRNKIDPENLFYKCTLNADPSNQNYQWQAVTNTLGNLRQKTNTKEVQFKRLSTSTSNSGWFGICLKIDKADTDFYNSLVIKFNKLNPEMARWFKTRANSSGSASVGRLWFSDKGVSGSAVFSAPDLPDHPSPLTDVEMVINVNYGLDADNFSIVVPPDAIKDYAFINRSGFFTDKIYHRYVYVFFNFSTSTFGETLSIANVQAANAIPVDFEDDTGVVMEDRSLSNENKEGVVFTDEYELQKKLSLNIPLLTNEEANNLDVNFFKKHTKLGFYVLGFGFWTGSSITNKYDYSRYSGFFEMDATKYEVRRARYNTYNIKLDLREVI